MTETASERRPPPADESPNGRPGNEPTEPREVELKYRVTDPAIAGHLLERRRIGPFEAEQGVETVETADRFLDTADRVFGARLLAVRLRATDGGTIVTVKGPSSAGPGGSVSRLELEGPAGGDDPSAWPVSAARDRVASVADGRPLLEVARLRQRRRRRLFRHDEDIVELTVDDVEVVDGDRVIDAWTEIEAELRAGDPDALADLGAALESTGSLRPAPESKYAAALRAIERIRDVTAGPTVLSTAGQRPSAVAAVGAPPTVMAPKEPPLAPAAEAVSRRTAGDRSLDELARSIVETQVERLLAHEAGTRSGDDEAVHKMRVATRRLRAAWRVFDDVLPGGSRLRRDIRRTARALGAVRDLDVLVAYLDRYAKANPTEQAALAPLHGDWSERREGARVDLLRVLDGRSYGRWPADVLDRIATDGGGRKGGAPPPRVRDSAGSRTWAAHERVRAFEPALRWADVPALHELRIADKRLRYTLEFFGDALGSDVRPLVERTVRLQDHIGELHDADVAAGLARAFLDDHATSATRGEIAAIGRFIGHADADVADRRSTVGTVWHAVAGLEFRRRLARVLADL
jgi:CHAD domain-containing protein